MMKLKNTAVCQSHQKKKICDVLIPISVVFSTGKLRVKNIVSLLFTTQDS